LIHDPNNYTDLDWTSPIQEHLREDFVLEDEHATSHTTIEDALSHRTGLPRHDLMYGQQGDTPSSVVKRIRYLPITQPPRTVFQYCNIMFGVATDLLENLTGQKLETILRDRIWGPLGMNSTSFSLPSEKEKASSQLARGYYWNPDAGDESASTHKDPYVPEPYLDIFPISGAGATISTVNDYSLWIKALLDAARNKTNSDSPITGSMLKDLFRPRTIVPLVALGVDDIEDFITPPLYALGWLNLKFLGELLVGHSGGLTGFGTETFMLPAKNFGFVTMGNTAGSSNTAGALIGALLMYRKLGKVFESQAALEEAHEVLRAFSQMDLSRNMNKSLKRSAFPPLSAAGLPLPGTLSDFAGVYTHPAYGAINFTVTAAEDGQVLEAFLYPRAWPHRLQLKHTTNTIFAVKMLAPHGLGDIHSKDIVWEEVGWDMHVIFNHGLDGKVVETMGIEIAPEMVEIARNLGPKHWKKGMVWFDRL
jgi:CubicO group peptidase (beta-lactamase class C family)